MDQKICKPLWQPISSRNGQSETMGSDPDLLLREFDPTPSHKVLKKMEFYFKPYNREIHQAKFMTFDSQTSDTFMMKQIEHYLAQSRKASPEERKEAQRYLESI